MTTSVLDNPWFRVGSAVIGVLVGLVQIVLFAWASTMWDITQQNRASIQELRVFEAETRSNRFTTSDALSQQNLLLEEVRSMERRMNTEMGTIKDCINRVIIDGNRARCN